MTNQYTFVVISNYIFTNYNLNSRYVTYMFHVYVHIPTSENNSNIYKLETVNTDISI